MVWSWIFHPQWGVVNAVLERLHLPTQRWLLEPRGIIELLVAPLGVEVPAWAAGPSLALVVLILFAIWYSIGFDTVVLLAALSNVPRELEDAARIDGASTVKLARYVTIPLLSPTLFFLAIISVIRSFQAFNHIYVLTGGGPLDTTCNATMYIFRSFYQYTKVGYGSAAAVLLFLIIVVLTVFQTRLLSRWVHY
jgi:multiple sugar transport system permease protein